VVEPHPLQKHILVFDLEGFRHGCNGVDRVVAQPDDIQVSVFEQGFSHDAGGVGKVDEPGVRCVLLHLMGNIQSDRNGAEGLEGASRTSGLLPDDIILQGYLLILDAGSHLADAHGGQHELGAFNGGLPAGAGGHTRIHLRIIDHALRHPAHDLEALFINIEQGNFTHLDFFSFWMKPSISSGV